MNKSENSLQTNTWVEGSDFKPVKTGEVEISQPLTGIAHIDEQTGVEYQGALLLVRLHGYPLGQVEIRFDGMDISPQQVADRIQNALGEQINQHLTQDGLNSVENLPVAGLPYAELPKCIATRRAGLIDAALISVVIATRDRAESLGQAMKSIAELDYPHYEVILVDNAPRTSATYDYFIQNQSVFEQRNISLRYMREDVPGLAVAHNRGLEAVKGDIVAFTDDDVVVDCNWLGEILRGFNASENIGCVTGLVIPLELRTPAQVLFEEFGGFCKGFTQQVYDLDRNKPADPLFPYTAGRFGTGANMAFNTEFLLKAGGFNPAFGIGTPVLGGDDMAAFYKIISAGKKLVYQPSAIIYHQHRRTYAELQKQMYGYGTGLTAFLANCVIENPGSIKKILTRVPAGIRYAFSTSSAKNEHKTSNYPRELEQIERKGMLSGPFRLVYSRREYRKMKPSFNNSSHGDGPRLAEHYLVLKQPDEEEIKINQQNYE